MSRTLVDICMQIKDEYRQKLPVFENVELENRRAYDRAYGNHGLKAVAKFLLASTGSRDGAAREMNVRRPESWNYLDAQGSINARVLVRILIEHMGEIELPSKAECQMHGLAAAMSHLLGVLGRGQAEENTPELALVDFLFYLFHNHGYPAAKSDAEVAARFANTVKMMRERRIPTPSARAGDLVGLVKKWGEPFVLALAINLYTD
jgi:hypothetical protein